MFAFSKTGSKEALARELGIARDESGVFDSYRGSVIEDLAKLPEEFNGAHVDVVTHTNGPHRKLDVNIIGKNIAI